MPIIIKIYARDVIDLTLVDLPGVCKNPTGDQPLDIEQRIYEIVLKYTQSPMSLIMAVSPANNDIAVSDGLKIAKQVDPDGERTIGVLTKIDLMDEGVDALDLIQGKLYPLKLGYVGVVCRSQKDIMTGKSLREGLKHEAQFFYHSPVYAAFAHRMGVPYLS